MASDTVFVEPEELIPVVEDVRSEGTEVYFNFDIGHWFICADAGEDISMPPEDVIKKFRRKWSRSFISTITFRESRYFARRSRKSGKLEEIINR